MPVPKGFVRKKLVKSYSRVCAKGSIRTVRSGAARILVCCPKGQWSKPKRCHVGTRAISIDKPLSGIKVNLKAPTFKTTREDDATYLRLGYRWAKIGREYSGKRRWYVAKGWKSSHQADSITYVGTRSHAKIVAESWVTDE